MNLLAGLGIKAEDLFVLTRRHAPLVRSEDQRHARKNHSYMWIFRRG